MILATINARAFLQATSKSATTHKPKLESDLLDTSNRMCSINELSWQARKSETTRNSIMEAALACFLSIGYTNTTVSKIAQEATVSRGAIMHHFDSRIDIIKSAINYLVDKRIEEFQNSLDTSIDPIARSEVSKATLTDTVNALWAFFRLPSFFAFQELLLAARTDPELAEIIQPAQQRFDQAINESITSMFPVWKDKNSARVLVNDLFHFTLQGMALSDMLKQDEQRTQNLLMLLIENGIHQYEQAEKLAH